MAMRTFCLSNYTTPLQLFLCGMANSCEEKDGDRGDIDGQPEKFDSRLWSCLKQGLQPGLGLSLCTVV